MGTYIAKYLARFQVPTSQTVNLLQTGRLVIFLDGLDEVRREDSSRVIKQIQKIADRHPQNQYIITCRIAAKEYTFQGFTEVEVADFAPEQIAAFVNNWFRTKDPVKAEKFLAKLENKQSIQELATNPLLLTLLCLVFEEKLDFTANRAELYEEGIDILLRKWDAGRNIERDEIYRRLTLKRKKDLLSKIAFTSFENATYFFKQKTVEKYIANYIQNLPDARTDDAALLLDSQLVLKSIVAQHGLLVPRAKNIYSFSHLTFHEYFTARQIIEVDKSTELVLENLVEHLWQNSWQEVFLLAVEMSSNADVLVVLMKRKIDSLLAKDNRLQEFLIWLNQKTLSVDSSYSPDEKREIQNRAGFIVDNNLTLDRNLYLYLHLHRDRNLYLDFNLNFNLYLDFNLYLYLNFNLYLDFNFDRNLDRILQLSKLKNTELHQEISNLKAQLPYREDKTAYKAWCRSNGSMWGEKLREIMIRHRNIGHDWQFSGEQQELLAQYYQANQFLTQCIAQECYVSRSVRQYVEKTLFLPMSEIEKYPDPLAK